MTRIFLTLASLTALAMVASAAIGILSVSQGSLNNPKDPTYDIHFLLGLFTVFGSLLVHCIIFTYFLGTGRWVKEVGLAYQLPDEPFPKRTRELKRATFPPALFAMLIAIATAATGAGYHRQEWPGWLHDAVALLAFAINIWAFRVEYRNLTANSVILEAVTREAERIRADRGLAPSAEALQQDSA
jgi:hypothetical protein